jgi:hypothetical protein
MENRKEFHPRITKLNAVAAFCFLIVGALPSGAQQSSAEAPYLDPTVPVEQRVNDLISRMKRLRSSATLPPLFPGFTFRNTTGGTKVFTALLAPM